ncbi:MAG: hypothetical protein WDZ70_01785 [Candidatus Paceibacterota bacterium]
MNNFRNNKGFTALTAAIIASVVLSLGIAILNITTKEIRLSSFSRNSTSAFYTAGSGIECALYWDKEESFATSSQSNPDNSIECFGASTSPSVVSSDGSSATTEFEIENTTTDTCVLVQVEKDTEGTTIESRGYSTCDEESERRLERGLRVNY